MGEKASGQGWFTALTRLLMSLEVLAAVALLAGAQLELGALLLFAGGVTLALERWSRRHLQPEGLERSLARIARTATVVDLPSGQGQVVLIDGQLRFIDSNNPRALA